MASKTAAAAGQVAAAAGQITHAVKSRGDSGGGVKGTLMQLGKQKLADTSFFKAYAGAEHNMGKIWSENSGNSNPFRPYQRQTTPESTDSQPTNGNKNPNNGIRNGNNGIKNGKKH